MNSSSTDQQCSTSTQQPNAEDALGRLQLSDHAQQQARMRCFTETAPDATLHFQIIDLGQQLYIWVAIGGGKLQNLYLAIQSRPDPNPSVATLLPDAASSCAASMAQRLARRTGRPVVCSCNLPPSADMLQVIAERRLCQELESMGVISSKAAAVPAAAAAALAAT